MSSSGTRRKVVLWSSDRRKFWVDETLAKESMFLKFVFANRSDVIALDMNFKGGILCRVIKYCRKHAELLGQGLGSDDAVEKAWETVFSTARKEVIFGVCAAANYLGVKSLFQLASEQLADWVGEPVLKIKEMANTHNSNVVSMLLGGRHYIERMLDEERLKRRKGKILQQKEMIAKEF